MTIYLGADHGGFMLKEQLKTWLTASGHQVVDCGAPILATDDDYPQYAAATARAVAVELAAGRSAAGFLLCKSGSGMVIAANKIPGTRAVELFDEKTTRHARMDNDANIGCFSGSWQSLDEIKVLIAVFLATPFSQAERHQRRIHQIAILESESVTQK